MRALTLHVSALNDAEYDTYTDALNDLTNDGKVALTSDEYYDKVKVGVREVRAWLRGRFPTVPIADVDSILKFFYAKFGYEDVLNGNQFFAVMRLVMHCKDGKGVDQGLAFIQVHPDSIASSLVSFKPQPPPTPARRFSQVTSFSEPDHNPFHAASRASSSKSVTPLKPPVHPDMNIPSSSSPSAPVPSPKNTNPFLSRSISDVKHEAKFPPLPPRKPISLLAPSQLPPPPPTRPTFLAPSNPVLKNMKTNHVLSPLMKQSLEASRVAYSLRKQEEILEQERILQVLKSSSANGSSSSSLRNTSSSPTKAVDSPPTSGSISSSEGIRTHGNASHHLPVLPPRRRSPVRAPSVAESSMSFEQVANARLLSRSPERGRIRPLPDVDEPRASSRSPTRHHNIDPPPTHPDRKHHLTSSEDTYFSAPSTIDPSPPSPTLNRSKSMHYQKPPPPPPSRSHKRPESVQVSQDHLSSDIPPEQAGRTPASPVFPVLTRHLSMSSAHSRASSMDSTPSVKKNIQKTFSSLQPKLDAARYKAEAGLSKKGYMNHTNAGGAAFKHWNDEGEERLIDYWEDGATVDGSSLSTGFDDDADDDGSVATRKPRRGLETDEMKWPIEEGWRPLR